MHLLLPHKKSLSLCLHHDYSYSRQRRCWRSHRQQRIPACILAYIARWRTYAVVCLYTPLTVLHRKHYHHIYQSLPLQPSFYISTVPFCLELYVQIEKWGAWYKRRRKEQYPHKLLQRTSYKGQRRAGIGFRPCLPGFFPTMNSAIRLTPSKSRSSELRQLAVEKTNR